MLRILIAPALSLLGACSVPSDQGAPTRPNILFIFSADHAPHAISAYGSKINKTPNIDRLAREGMLFTNTFCGNSICGPSRATILTGLHCHAHGFMRNGNRFDGTQQTFPQLLQDAGYQTAVIGNKPSRHKPIIITMLESVNEQLIACTNRFRSRFSDIR